VIRVDATLLRQREGNPTSRLMLACFGAIAEFERSLLRERQRDAFALALPQQ